MTDKEIIKAFEHCTNNGDCSGCSLDGTVACVPKLFKEVFNLINRYEAEIERLTVNMNAFGLGMIREKERADNARSEAAKEFAERLKDKVTYHEDECGEFAPWVDCRDITALVKEMTEGQE